MTEEKKVRHILGISGGKDSSALAVYLRDKVSNMEYFFCDTGAELEETYEYLAKLEKYLGKPIIRLNPVKNFDWWLQRNGNFLPSQRMRWCTIQLKLAPLEDFVGDDQAISYVGIRADEDTRKGYQSPRGNIQSIFPFKEDGIDKEGVMKILEHSGLGLPSYYEWRTRSGCYFCFYQRKMEWVGLLERHPDLFEKAKSYEKFDEITGKRFTWMTDESLDELAYPERVLEIKRKHYEQLEKEKALNKNKPLSEVFADSLDAEDDTLPCQICSL
ncbi:MAG: phosphoadenosine phosphosulfate reductase family protein [Cyanobacteria bacterium REEB446]|jgi:3'-phosphoadenosine 5'-phosphosulfate sulfotransferase (PAPS reductase)/FAD synthetase|nr:phosphoadenosine phosphosulfate reductase family protein [Cyanobacteria bacterium REEB446]